jgi:hypothetical protein
MPISATAEIGKARLEGRGFAGAYRGLVRVMAGLAPAIQPRHCEARNLWGENLPVWILVDYLLGRKYSKWSAF